MHVRAAPLLLLLFAASACAHDQTTAVEHESIASHHRANAEQAEAVATVHQTVEPLQSGSEADRSGANRFDDVTAGKAAYEIDTASKHERAAHRIRVDAALRCHGVPASQQVSCPVELPGRVEPVIGGVRIVATGSPSAEALRAQIDCALARARVDHPADWATCPLYVPGATARVVELRSRVNIEILTSDGAEVDELRRRAAHAGGGAP